ncbi:MAG: hypothetical protein PWP53_2246 [Lacrimispora sp.]|nr:hypothetical protein [Lacrimispora sp.]
MSNEHPLNDRRKKVIYTKRTGFFLGRKNRNCLLCTIYLLFFVQIAIYTLIENIIEKEQIPVQKSVLKSDYFSKASQSAVRARA